VLFALVTGEGTKRSLDLEGILGAIPKTRRISEKDLRFCLQELQRIKVLRALEPL
jgi:hypothetical protein